MNQSDPGAPSPAPSMLQRAVAVLENEALAHETFRLRLAAPELAARIRPGQFLMIRSGGLGRGGAGPLLGRPFALYDVARDHANRPTAVDVVYQVVGPGTAALATCRAGDLVETWGPLGNGFRAPPPQGKVVFVAGGIGQTPFLALGRWWLGLAGYGPELRRPAVPVSSATLLYGVRTANLLAGLADFRAAGVEVEVATDDGTAGHHGFVTDLLNERLRRGDIPDAVIGCGPPGLLAALARLTGANKIPCDLSLENHMACGFGACFSCVTPIRQADGSIDLLRVCTDGPVFPAANVVF